jgi:NAD+ synthase (glutamine-hydrolysing)
MRVGIGQINAHVGAIERNRDRILAMIDDARRQACDLVVFPELAVCGYPPLDSMWRPGYVAACEEAVEVLRAASRGIAVIVGTITAHGTREAINRYDLSSLADDTGADLFNTAVLIEDEQIVGRAAKIHLPCYDVYDESRYFAPGPGSEVFTLGDTTIGINVCEDLWVDDGPTEIQASLGAEWIVNLSASPFYVGKRAIRHQVIRRRAIENGVGVVYANLVGGQDDIVFDGGSVVVDADGAVRFEAPSFVDGLYVVDLSDPHPVPSLEMSELNRLRSALVLGIRDYVAKNGFTSAVVGLSGGIDSALVTALAVDALGSEHVTAVYLPSRFSSEESQQAARDLARRLSIELIEIPIDGVHEAVRHAMPAAPTGLADENLQPRIRATFWMGLANQRNALVLCAGNKSEIAVGYSTLYGDTTGALAPIADLYKTDVYRLAASFDEWIPSRILERPPTAELRPNQRDDDDLPPYEVLDPLLAKIIDDNRSRAELLAEGIEPELLKRILPRYYASEYKRRQLPPGIKVSPKAFGVGRRMPITNAYWD